jgi:hypothetical protein
VSEVTERTQKGSCLSELISIARQKNGWATLTELYREKNPKVDYQSWLHAESGRRIPNTKNLLEMGAILGIPKEDLIIAYCKDKFVDEECHLIVDSFLFKKYIDVDSLIDANKHIRIAHIYTPEQIEAMKKDVRINQFLRYTYDWELKTTISRLAQFFNLSFEEANEIVEKLQSLKLVKVEGETVIRCHRHLDMPATADVYDLRKNLLIASLQQNIKPSSHITNFHVMLGEDSIKKVMAFVYFAEANFMKMTKEDYLSNKKDGSAIQIAIAVNKVNEGFRDE